MGIRGEIFSNKIMLPNRTYFFNIKENRNGDLYLNIVESKNRDSGGFDRQSVILFADDLQEFLKGFDESLRVMEKAMREKRQSGKVSAKKTGDDSKTGSAPRRNFSEGSNKGERKFVKRYDDRNNRPERSERSNRPNRTERSRERDNNRGSSRGGNRERSGSRERNGERRPGGDRKPGGNKRVVVRKRD